VIEAVPLVDIFAGNERCQSPPQEALALQAQQPYPSEVSFRMAASLPRLRMAAGGNLYSKEHCCGTSTAT
jgi:hypothetical protein